MAYFKALSTTDSIVNILFTVDKIFQSAIYYW